MTFRDRLGMRWFRLRGPAVPATAAVVSVAVGLELGNPAALRVVLAAVIAGFLAACGLRAPRALLIALVWWLVLLGLLRRLVSGVSPVLPQGDPLLLVAAVAWTCLALMAFRRGALTGRTALTTSVLALTGLLAVSAINPFQGGIAVGLGGILLVVIPMLAFWVGRTICDDRCMSKLLRLVIVLACAGAVYGLVQTFLGLPSWDQRWVTESGYTALDVNGVIRGFANFSSGAEYGAFVAVGIICLVAFAGRLRRLLLLLPALGLLSVALWFESSRGTVVLLLAALCLMMGAAKGISLLRTVLMGLAILAALPFVIARVTPAQSNGAGSQLSAHQLTGLSDPFGQASTLPGHIREVFSGVREAVSNPIGRGVGSVTIAANKFGAAGNGTDADPGNVAVAAGVLGLLAYICVFVLGFRSVYKLALLRRDAISLAALGVLTVMLLQWLNGAQYSVAFLPWLLLGWSDRSLGRAAVIVEQRTLLAELA